MKKKLTLAIDEETYDLLQDLPRRISISELASWMFKIFVKEYKDGRELTEDELIAFLESTPEGRDFRQRGKEQFGPAIKKYNKAVDKVKKVGRPSKKAKKDE